MITNDLPITPHFGFNEMTRSEALNSYNKKNAGVNGFIPVDNQPTDEELGNLYYLCECLEKLRKYNGILTINSAYRNDFVNKLVGGSPFSYHRKGLAADIRCCSFNEAINLAVSAKKLLLSADPEDHVDFCEIIVSTTTRSWWLHVAVSKVPQKAYVPIKLDISVIAKSGVYT